MGLLDALNDPLMAGAMGLLAASGPSRTPVSLGQAIGQGFGAMQDSQNMNARRKLMEMQAQMQKLQLDEATQAANQRGQISALARDAYLTPQQQAISANGPTNEAAASIPSFKPRFDTEAFLSGLSRIDPLKAMEMRSQMTPKPIKLGTEEMLLDPATYQPLAKGMGKEQKPLEIERMLDAAGITDPAARARFMMQAIQKQTTHQPPVSVSYGAPVAGADEKGNPVFFQPDKGGGKPAIIPGVSPPKPDKPLTESQAKASAFLGQMKSAEDALTKIGKVSPASVAVAESAPMLSTATAQQANQARQQWAEAFLRFKTGAAATKDEVQANINTYFPRIGESKEVIEQKRIMRQQAMNDMAIAAGSGAGKSGSVYADTGKPRGIKFLGFE